MTCRHWNKRCTLGLYGGRPSPGVCRICPSYKGPLRGAGDLVRLCVNVLFLGRGDIAERLVERTQALWARRWIRQSAPGYSGARPGGCGCKQRQVALNNVLPFGERHGH